MLEREAIRCQINEGLDCTETDTDCQSGGAPESVNHELIFRQISPLAAPRDSVYDVFVARKKRVHTDAKCK